MGTKTQLTVTVDESVKGQLDARDDINNSGLVNDLLKQYLAGESKDNAADKMRAERLKQEAKELQTEASGKRKQADAILDSIKEEQQQREAEWERAVDSLTPKLKAELNSVDRDYHNPDPDDQAVQMFAERIGITPVEFCERFHDKRARYYNGDDGTPERGVQ